MNTQPYNFSYPNQKRTYTHEEANNVVVLREAVGVFPDDEHLLAAIDDLEMAEFSREDISVLGNKTDAPSAYHMEDDPNVPRGVYVTPEEHSLAEASMVGGGILLAVFLVGPMMGPDLMVATNVFMLMVIAAIGGILGYVAARIYRNYRQNHSRSQRRQGGLLLWVNTPTHEREEKAQHILSRHGARDVHVNEVVREIAA
jgi:positive regulator of sigma E activity